MAVSPLDFLQQAKQLANNAVADVDYRNAVGRAYYAAFHAANVFHSWLPQPGRLPAQTTGLHDQLFHRLINPTIPAADSRHRVSRIVGYKTRDFHRIRVQADYDLNQEMKIEDAINAISRAEEIVRIIDTEMQIHGDSLSG